MASISSEVVTQLWHSLVGGEMSAALPLLHPDVFCSNQPWEPMTGAQAVCDYLQPLIDGTCLSLKEMSILHQVAEGRVVMNAREETWSCEAMELVLSVAGLFVVEKRLVTRWIDYWD
jgi:limonene-1,2-epoxide hydrolase